MMRQGIARACRRLSAGVQGHSTTFSTGGKAALASVSSQQRALFVSHAAAHFKSGNGSRQASAVWLLPAAVAAAIASSETLHAAEKERTFIMVKPDGVQRGLISEIIARFEKKGYKLVALKMVIPSKAHAQKHYHDLKERPFFNGLCDFLSSGPVVAMVWEGQGVIKYGRKIIGATSPLASEPGTVRGDCAVSIGRNIIHGSDGPEGAVDEIKLWFKPEELSSYHRDSDKWIYE